MRRAGSAPGTLRDLGELNRLLRRFLVPRDRRGFVRASAWAVAAAVVNAVTASATLPVTRCLTKRCPAWVGGASGTHAVITAAVIAGVVATLQLVTQLMLSLQTVRLNQDVQRNTVRRLLDGYLHLPWREFTARNQAHYLRRCLTTAVDAAFVTRQCIGLVSATVTLALLTVVMVLSSPAVVLLLIAGVGATGALLLTRVGRTVRDASHEREGALRDWTLTTTESLTSFKEIRAHNREALFTDAIEDPLRRLSRSNTRLGFMPTLPGSFFDFLGIAVVMVVTTFWLLSGRSLAELVPHLVFYAVVAQVFQPALVALLSTRSLITGSVINIELVLREYELVACREDRVRVVLDGSAPPGLHVRGVNFAHRDGPQVLQNAWFTHRHGTWTALVGPSGAGKTTVLELVCGLLPPDDGTVALGWPVDTEPTISYVPQQIALLDGSLVDNVLFGSDGGDEARFDRALRTAHLTQLVATLPAGRDSRLGPNGTTLSGGQRQRLALARALYREPDFLFLDEATSGLDEATEVAVLDAIRRNYPGISVVYVTHRPGTLRYADHVVEVRDGALVPRTGP